MKVGISFAMSLFFFSTTISCQTSAKYSENYQDEALDYSVSDKEKDVSKIRSAENRKSTISSTLIISNTNHQYTFEEFEHLLKSNGESVASLNIIKDKQGVQKYTNDEKIKVVILLNLK